MPKLQNIKYHALHVFWHVYSVNSYVIWKDGKCVFRIQLEQTLACLQLLVGVSSICARLVLVHMLQMISLVVLIQVYLANSCCI